MNCGDPGMPENAMRIGEKFLYQDNVTFICNDGYYQSSGPEGGVRYCLDTGLWSDTQPQCQCEFICELIKQSLSGLICNMERVLTLEQFSQSNAMYTKGNVFILNSS